MYFIFYYFLRILHTIREGWLQLVNAFLIFQGYGRTVPSTVWDFGLWYRSGLVSYRITGVNTRP